MVSNFEYEADVRDVEYQHQSGGLKGQGLKGICFDLLRKVAGTDETCFNILIVSPDGENRTTMKKCQYRQTSASRCYSYLSASMGSKFAAFFAG
jgi:hypothetical protein